MSLQDGDTSRFCELAFVSDCDYLKKMLGEKVEMEVVVEIVVEVAAKVL